MTLANASFLIYRGVGAMRLNEISDNRGAKHNRKRVGRGEGSGTGKTSGKGQKGQKSRSGVAIKGFEGGQMPLYRRLPKRGFTNIFRKQFVELNIGRLQDAVDAGKLAADKIIDGEALLSAGVIRRLKDGVRLLGNGKLSAKLVLNVAGATRSAIAAVEENGGEVTFTVSAIEQDDSPGIRKKSSGSKKKAAKLEKPNDQNSVSDES